MARIWFRLRLCLLALSPVVHLQPVKQLQLLGLERRASFASGQLLLSRGRPQTACHGSFNVQSCFPRYAEFVANQIRGHDSAVPLFVYAAFQGVHYPLQVPRKYFQRYAEQGADAGACMWDEQGTTPAGHQNGFTCKPNPNYPGLSHVGAACECNRLLVKAQVSALSEAVGNITCALQERGLWNNTVLIFMGDNGGK